MAIFLDIETLDFFSDPHVKALPRVQQIAAMRFGCAVTHRTDSNSWQEWQSIGQHRLSAPRWPA